MKKLIALILILSTFYFVGCQWKRINFDYAREAISVAESFCLALSEDFELAKEYLHPDSTPSKDEFQKFIEEIEQENNIRFSNGVALKEREGVRFELGTYESPVYEYKFACEIVVGVKTMTLSFVVRKETNHYSIMNVEPGSTWEED